MNFFEKRKLKWMLQPCNFILAGEVIQSKFGTKTGQNALNDLIQDYIADPGFELAVKLIDYEPQLTIYFIECNPEGFYSRQMQKKMIDTQEHQAFVAHLSGDEEFMAGSGLAATATEATVHKSPAVHGVESQKGSPLSRKRARKPAQEEQEMSRTSTAAAQSTKTPPQLTVPSFLNVIQTLRDSVRELEQQVVECEREIAELERHGTAKADMRRRWLTVCKEGVREFETAIRLLQSYENPIK